MEPIYRDSDNSALPEIIDNAAIERLAKARFPNSGSRQLPMAQITRALARVNLAQSEWMVQLLVELGGDVAPLQVGRLYLGRRVLWSFLEQAGFDHRLAARLKSGMVPMLAAAAADDSWLQRHDHPLNELLFAIQQLARGWYPQHARAEDIVTVCQRWLADVADGEFDVLLLDIHNWRENFNGIQKRLAQRIQEAESGSLRVADMREFAGRTITRLVAGRPLPVAPVNFIAQLRSYWLPGMQWILLHQGTTSPTWSRVTRMLGLVIWALQADVVRENRTGKWARTVREIRKELGPLLGDLLREEKDRETVESQLLELLQKLASGKRLNREVMEPLSGASALDSLDASLSQDLQQEIRLLTGEEWFLEVRSGRRIRLLVKDADHQRLVFVDQAGIRTGTFSYEEFAWQISMGNLVAVAPLSSCWSMAVAHLGLKLVEPAMPAPAIEQLRKARRQVKAEIEAFEQACGAVTPDNAVEQEEANPGMLDERRRVRLEIASLAVGTWLEFSDGESVRRLRLLVVMPSSGKYLFVDRSGVNRREYSREHLVTALCDGQARLLDPLVAQQFNGDEQGQESAT